MTLLITKLFNYYYDLAEYNTIPIYYSDIMLGRRYIQNIIDVGGLLVVFQY